MLIDEIVIYFEEIYGSVIYCLDCYIVYYYLRERYRVRWRILMLERDVKL